MSITIGIASDHAGFELKQKIREFLTVKKIVFKDYGTHSLESCDYPDYAHALAQGIESGEVQLGIVCCGSGNGVNITVNKHKGIRSALCWNEEITSLARRHNNANVMAVPARFINPNIAFRMVEIFLACDFEGGRHQKRVDKIEPQN